MASKKISSSPSPFLIGNCQVVVEAKNFTSISDANNLQISTTRTAKIKISVGRGSTSKDDYAFIVVNSKDSNECTKSYLQEALEIYTRELPAMSFAANTGKQSKFLEKCVSNGKYCSLLLKLKHKDNPGEVIAAISYQIVPADTQYAEIPLAAVSSLYQNKGLGRFLYLELKKRLSNVGVRVIYCWGDKESKGFWLKQGFESIAEVDLKGKARRLPIKANVRRALCFPGGSILMVSHLNEYSSTNFSELMEFQFPLKPHIESTSPVDKVFQPVDGRKTLQAETEIPSKKSCHSETEGLSRETFSREANKSDGICSDQNFEEQDSYGGKKSSKNTSSGELDKIMADIDVEYCSCFTQGKKRAWEASLSSLKSKKVKGSHQIECQTESVLGLGSDKRGPCFHGCSLGMSKCSSFMEATARGPLTTNSVKNNAKDSKSTTMESGALVSNEPQPQGERVRIMLMNIADDTKKAHLTKVIELLGGIVTHDGSSSTHVVTGKVRKTLNFCTALCTGAWIVSSSWLKDSFRRGIFVDESAYILHDEEYEVRYKMGLKDAVLKAKVSPGALFKGYNVCIASRVQPPAKTLSAIIKSAGGNIISGMDKVKETSKTMFIACEEDMEEVLSASRKGIRTFSCEWLMTCIMRQELDLQALQFAESL
ncbi:N-acetyltransferases N-acetyltransferases [Euphorbia peplus]|nr:N-acetyltransferases N-acetyltransferases [Euphorbia peplus]